MKYDKAKIEAQLNKEYFDRKVDLIPTSLKETYSDLVSKKPVLVSRELIVDGRTLIGIEYATDGEVANVYTTDAKGKRVNFENSTEQGTSNTAPDLISERLATVKSVMPHETEHTPAKASTEKKPVKQRKVDTQVLGDKMAQQRRA